MNRLKRELYKRNIIQDASEFPHDIYDETEVDFVGISGDFLITIVYSPVLNNILNLYDRRTFQLIGSQNQYPDKLNCTLFSNFNKWESCFSFNI